MKKVIEFDMPAGATFGKFRHLGGGRFKYDPEAVAFSPLSTDFPTIFEGSLVSDKAVDGTHFRADIVDAPEGQLWRMVHFADFYAGDELIESGNKISDEAMMALASLAGVADGVAPEWHAAEERPSVATERKV